MKRVYKASIEVTIKPGMTRKDLCKEVATSLYELLETCQREILNGPEAP